MTRTLVVATALGFAVAMIVSIVVKLLSLEVQGPYLGVVAGAASGITTVALWNRSARQHTPVPASARSHPA